MATHADDFINLVIDLHKAETNFFNGDFCSNVSNLDKVIADDYLEFGKSGRIHHKNDVIDELVRCGSRDITIENFTVNTLGTANLFLVHYKSVDGDGNRALRYSIWQKTQNGYKILFHQGTSTTE